VRSVHLRKTASALGTLLEPLFAMRAPVAITALALAAATPARACPHSAHCAAPAPDGAPRARRISLRLVPKPQPHEPVFAMTRALAHHRRAAPSTPTVFERARARVLAHLPRYVLHPLRLWPSPVMVSGPSVTSAGVGVVGEL
jgi:hypothetical protein